MQSHILFMTLIYFSYLWILLLYIAFLSLNLHNIFRVGKRSLCFGISNCLKYDFSYIFWFQQHRICFRWHNFKDLCQHLFCSQQSHHMLYFLDFLKLLYAAIKMFDVILFSQNDFWLKCSWQRNKSYDPARNMLEYNLF